MKMTINQNKAIGETEIIINCTEMDSRIRNLVDYIRQYSISLEGEIDGEVYYVPLESVIYIDSVDKRTFFYDRHRIFRSRNTLAALSEKLVNCHFARISKNCIVNLAWIQCVRPYDNHRLELTMENGEHLIAGRTYQKQLLQSLKGFSAEDAAGIKEPLVTGGLAASSFYAGERSVFNLGKVLCFSEIPQRVAALSFGIAELLCALGLEDKLAVIAPAEDILAHTLPQYQEVLAKVPLLLHDGDGVPAAEELRALGVDLTLCSWYFQKRLAPDVRDTLGLQMYVAESTVPEKAGMEQFYRDVLNIGRIFHAEDRSAALAEQMRRRITALTRRLSGKKRVRVFVYDGGESNPMTAMKGTLENDLISLAGGENVFGGWDGSYHAVSWQQAADAGPEVIIVHDYPDSMTLEEKLAYLKNRPELRSVPALQQERFVVLSLLEIFPGIQNPIAVEKMIRGFHPGVL